MGYSERRAVKAKGLRRANEEKKRNGKKTLTEEPDRSLRVPREKDFFKLSKGEWKILCLICFFYRVTITDGVEKRVTRYSTGKCWVPVTK